MATYVDEAIWEWRGRRWCHLTADTDEELHAMAARLGLVRQWFQSKPNRPWTDHYDLPEEVRLQAIACGAQPLTRREMAQRLARLRSAQANAKLVRSVVDAFNRGDWETWESLWHEDGDWFDPPDAPGSGVHHGVERIRRYFDELIELGADGWKVEIDEVRSVGPDRVLIEARSVIVGRGSGIALEDGLFQLVDLEDGRVRRVRNFRTRTEALSRATRPPP